MRSTSNSNPISPIFYILFLFCVFGLFALIYLHSLRKKHKALLWELKQGLSEKLSPVLALHSLCKPYMTFELKGLDRILRYQNKISNCNKHEWAAMDNDAHYALEKFLLQTQSYLPILQNPQYEKLKDAIINSEKKLFTIRQKYNVFIFQMNRLHISWILGSEFSALNSPDHSPKYNNISDFFR